MLEEAEQYISAIYIHVLPGLYGSCLWYYHFCCDDLRKHSHIGLEASLSGLLLKCLHVGEQSATAFLRFLSPKILVM